MVCRRDSVVEKLSFRSQYLSPEVMAVIKANAYGHGSVAVARHLSANGIRHFAVATAAEGQELRQAGIKDFIQVFGKLVQHTHTHIFLPCFSFSFCSHLHLSDYPFFFKAPFSSLTFSHSSFFFLSRFSDLLSLSPLLNSFVNIWH